MSNVQFCRPVDIALTGFVRSKRPTKSHAKKPSPASKATGTKGARSTMLAVSALPISDPGAASFIKQQLDLLVTPDTSSFMAGDQPRTLYPRELLIARDDSGNRVDGPPAWLDEEAIENGLVVQEASFEDYLALTTEKA
jgi:hypothetical protein